MGDGDGWVQCALGHRHWGRFGAAGLLVNADHDFVLQHRAPWTHEGGTWGLPGGARDSHEDAVTSALREAKEEADIDDTSVAPVALTVDDHGGWSYTTVAARPRTSIEPRSVNAEVRRSGGGQRPASITYPCTPDSPAHGRKCVIRFVHSPWLSMRRTSWDLDPMDGGVTGWARHGGCVMNSHHLSGTVFRRMSCQPEPTPGDSPSCFRGSRSSLRVRRVWSRTIPLATHLHGGSPRWAFTPARGTPTPTSSGWPRKAGRAASKLSW